MLGEKEGKLVGAKVGIAVGALLGADVGDAVGIIHSTLSSPRLISGHWIPILGSQTISQLPSQYTLRDVFAKDKKKQKNKWKIKTRHKIQKD